MRAIFSEEHKYRIWRRLWVELARAEHDAGLVSQKELRDLEKYRDDISIERIMELEKETRHDVVAAIREFAEKAKIGGGKIHLGATSMDIVDNTDMIRMKEGLHLTEKKIKDLLTLFSELMQKYAHTACIGFTHLQPAEPTTIGYRFAFYAQDLLYDLAMLRFVKETIRAKGMKGAVGTAASYQALLHGTSVTPSQLEQNIMAQLGIDAALISTQVYTRKYDYIVLTLLSSIASSMAKFAGDLRILQSPMYGEWSEPFGKTQVGSSAMPFKKNPINAEKICSLARYVAQLPAVALENATLSYLERTLDDSANKRLCIPESFLSVDEILETGKKIVKGIVIHEDRIEKNLQTYAPFAATEAILMSAVKRGANRQEMHETLRTIAMKAWQSVQSGKHNPMFTLLKKNSAIGMYLNQKEIDELVDVKTHIGDAPLRVESLIKQITIETERT